MKKIIIHSLVFAIVIGGIAMVAINFKSICNTVAIKFWNEIFKVRQHTTYGDVGRDTIFVLGDGKFQVGKFSGDKVFFMHNENQTTEVLLQKVARYKGDKSNLYVISEEGYGIADSKTNKCRLYITVPPEEFIRGYGTDSEGIQHPISRFLNDEHIQYLNSYDDFSSEEKAIFEKIKK